MATTGPAAPPARQKSLAETDWEAHLERNRRVIALLDRWDAEDASLAAAGEPPEEPVEITPFSLREVKLD